MCNFLNLCSCSTPAGLQVEWACHEDGWFTWMVWCGVLHRVWFGNIYGSSKSAANLVQGEKGDVEYFRVFWKRKGKEDETFQVISKKNRIWDDLFDYLKDCVVQCVQGLCIVLQFVFSMCSELPGFVWILVYCFSKSRKERSLTVWLAIFKENWRIEGECIPNNNPHGIITTYHFDIFGTGHTLVIPTSGHLFWRKGHAPKSQKAKNTGLV